MEGIWILLLLGMLNDILKVWEEQTTGNASFSRWHPQELKMYVNWEGICSIYKIKPFQ